ncbi:hypothetical protein SAMN05421839_11160 [Halolactibacillus halophilus]|uniref:Uncharacterized protein n=1 Tax=Halolactibacillus halophilus TaxID=306540 RepID=A0A1I5NW70_9BACI|nr:hypothetical protein [Halolactibacillus halophilus]GEM01476.1 hypothetical protein HHA03_10080 [Halolactibacillus halophilus]SFP26058.1 hypothetical protein SAMN05421839_11160 [Halolactibacillus halophilus]
MFINETIKVATKGRRLELVIFTSSLIIQFYLANTQLHYGSSLTSIAFMLLSSILFRYIIANERFFHNDQPKLTYENVVDYVFSKNICTVVFVFTVFMFVIQMTRYLHNASFNFQNYDHILVYCLMVLGAENLLYGIYQTPVPIYNREGKEEKLTDHKIDWKNIKIQWPSFVMLGLYCVTFLAFDFVPHLLTAMMYYIISVFIFINSLRSVQV